MKSLIIASVLCVSPAVHAFEHSKNPDVMPSIGISAMNGTLPGILRDTPSDRHTNGSALTWAVDFRYPLTNTVTLTVMGELTGINNNKDYTNGTRAGIGARFYLPEMR